MGNNYQEGLYLGNGYQEGFYLGNGYQADLKTSVGMVFLAKGGF